MERIIYISSAKAPLASAELDDILAASRRNNPLVGVTGLLVVGGRRFLQVLEGAEHAIEGVFRRIEQDPRHRAVVILSRKQIEAPSFGDWAMGYRLGGTAAGAAPSLPETVAQLLAPIEDPTVRAYFEGFAEVHAAA